jgi:hypothetical protein
VDVVLRMQGNEVTDMLAAALDNTTLSVEVGKGLGLERVL